MFKTVCPFCFSRSPLPLTYHELQGQVNPEFDLDLDKLGAQIEIVLALTLEQSSLRSWQVMGHWLCETISARLPRSPAYTCHQMTLKLLNDLPKVTTTMLEAMITSPLVEKVNTCLQQLTSNENGKFIILHNG